MAQTLQVVVTNGHFHLLCPLRPGSRHPFRSALFRQWWKQQMDSNTCPNCRLPNLCTLSFLLLPIQKKPHHCPESHHETPLSLGPNITLPLSWHIFSSRLYVILHWPLIPPSLNLLPHLRKPIGLQCSVFLFPQLPKVHSFYSKLFSPPHYLLHSPCLPIRFLRFQDPKREIWDRVLNHPGRLSWLRAHALGHPALF